MVRVWHPTDNQHNLPINNTMYRNTNDFLNHWKYESEATLKVLNNLTDESLEQRVYAGGRTLRDLAWHITLTLTELPGNAGLSVEGPQEGQPAPQSAQEMAAAYHQAANSVGEQVKAHWSDETLPEKVQMYGQDWTKGYSLNALIDHQAHHRGQMTVLMRQAGLKVPGVYGPSKEEWEAMGAPALP